MRFMRFVCLLLPFMAVQALADKPILKKAATPAPPIIDCIGPTTAKKNVVYLHGMDTDPPSSQEFNNRKVLHAIANQLNIRFALPRSKMPCQKNADLLCWTNSAKAAGDLATMQEGIEAGAKACFPQKKYSLLGFSNGGIAAGAVLRLCIKNDYQSIITVGAGGAWWSTDPKKLAECGPNLIALAGTTDNANRTAIKGFISHIKTLQGKASLIEYEGGHQLNKEALIKAFEAEL